MKLNISPMVQNKIENLFLEISFLKVNSLHIIKFYGRLWEGGIDYIL